MGQGTGQEGSRLADSLWPLQMLLNKCVVPHMANLGLISTSASGPAASLCEMFRCGWGWGCLFGASGTPTHVLCVQALVAGRSPHGSSGASSPPTPDGSGSCSLPCWRLH